MKSSVSPANWHGLIQPFKNAVAIPPLGGDEDVAAGAILCTLSSYSKIMKSIKNDPGTDGVDAGSFLKEIFEATLNSGLNIKKGESIWRLRNGARKTVCIAMVSFLADIVSNMDRAKIGENREFLKGLIVARKFLIVDIMMFENDMEMQNTLKFFYAKLDSIFGIAPSL